jgi:hypothetical protein
MPPTVNHCEGSTLERPLHGPLYISVILCFTCSMTSEHNRNVALDLVLTLLLCGLWNMVVQYHHCQTFNFLLKEEKYNFWRVYLFSFLTCGIYLVYHEYCKANDFAKLSGTPDSSDPVLAIVLSILGLNFVYDAILQSKINDHLTSLSVS